MNNDIKEILEQLKALASDKWIMLDLSNEEYKMLYDYITNLQEENERLNYCYSAMILNFQLAINKIDKAIEKLKDTNVDMPSTLLIEVIDYAAHILQGSDKK